MDTEESEPLELKRGSEMIILTLPCLAVITMPTFGFVIGGLIAAVLCFLFLLILQI